jgi:hypothetical protein
MQAAYKVVVSYISKPCGLTTENSLTEGVVEEGILNIKLLNWLVTGDKSSKHHANGGQLHNRAESLIVVDPRALSETSEDAASLVVIKGPVVAKLVHKDPLTGDDVGATGPRDKLPGPIAHQGPILVLHSRAPIGVNKRITFRVVRSFTDKPNGSNFMEHQLLVVKRRTERRL